MKPTKILLTFIALLICVGAKSQFSVNPQGDVALNGVLSIGATLIVDNGIIVNAEIIINAGGSLIIQNNGIIQQGENDNVDIQLGGTLQISSGEIRIHE